MKVVTRTIGPILPEGAISNDTVHVWTVDVREGEEFKDFLNADEQSRAARYSIEAPRRQFAILRASLRKVLGAYLTCSPREVAFTLEAGGKPQLKNRELQFNVSHSGDLGLIAIANQRVGIDVEAIRPMPNADGLVRRFFSEREGEQYRALPEELKMAGFFRGWTAKEALLKAVGVGLQDLESCIVDLDPRNAPAIVRFDHAARAGTRWTWQPLDVAGDYVSALALEKETAG